MGYLLHVSHDAENLQFYLWLQDYRRRFSLTTSNEQSLSPPWNTDLVPQNPPFVDGSPRLSEKEMAQIMNLKIDFDNKEAISDESVSMMSGSTGLNNMKLVEFANQQTGLKWQSCSH